MGSVFQKSLSFDGVNEHVLMGDVLDFDQDETFSIACWFKTTDSAGYLVSKFDGNPVGWGMHVDGSGSLQFIIWSTPNGIQVATTATGFNDGQWHHGCVTFSGNGLASGLTFYVDGVLQAKATPVSDNLAGASILNAGQLQINGTSASSWITANQCQASVYDVELTAAQVTTLYGLGDPPDLRLVGPRESLVGYWPLGDGDDFPILYDRNLVSVQTSSIPDESDNSNAGTPTNMEAGDFRSVILAAEGTPDLSGSGNNGTNANIEDADFTTDTPGGTSRYSVLLDEVNERIHIGDVTELSFERTDPFSVSCWFKTVGTAAGARGLVTKRTTSGDFRGWGIFMSGNDTLNFQVRSSGSSQISLSTTVTYEDGMWHHALFTYDGSSSAAGAKVYMDGVEQSVEVSADNLTTTVDNTAPAQIGANNSAFHFNGYMDEVAVWNKALTAAEAKAVFNEGRVHSVQAAADVMPDLSGNMNVGTPTNMEDADFTTDVAGGNWTQHSMTLDGVNEYVSIADDAVIDFDRTDPFSLSIWFKSSEATNSTMLLSKLDNGDNFRGYELTPNSSGQIGFQVVNTSSTDNMVIRTTGSFNDGAWHHVVATWDGDVAGGVLGANIYVDGVLEAVSTTFDNLTGPTTNSVSLLIGARNPSSFSMDGLIDEAAIYDKELSLVEILAVYNAGKPRDARALDTSSSLVGYWNCGDVMVGNPPDLRSLGSGPDLVGYWRCGDAGPGGSFSRHVAVMDGVNEYVAIGDVVALQFAHTDAFSVSAWFRTASSGNESVFSKRLNAGTFRGWALATNSGTLVWQLVNTTSTNLIQVTTTAATFADGAWHHVVCTYDGLQAVAGAKVYVDGVLQAVTENNDTLSATVEGGGLFQIGALAGSFHFDGSIADVAVWDRELSSLDVRDVYDSGIPNNLRELWSGTNLAGWWRMGNGGNDGTATNMEAADVANDAPHGQLASEEVVTVDTLDNVTLETGAPTPLFRMRGVDDGVGPPVGYVFWDVQDTPDFDASRAAVTFPATVGSIVVDSIAVVAQT